MGAAILAAMDFYANDVCGSDGPHRDSLRIAAGLLPGIHASRSTRTSLCIVRPHTAKPIAPGTVVCKQADATFDL